MIRCLKDVDSRTHCVQCCKWLGLRSAMNLKTSTGKLYCCPALIATNCFK